MALLCQDESCPAHEYELSLRTAQLENVFEKTLAQVRQLFDSESTRIVQVDRLLLEADNDSLRMRCQQTDKEISELVEAESNFRQQLLEAHNEISNLKAALRTNSRTIQDLKNELASQNRKLLEYETVLAEKLSLAKELSDLQPELNRLRSQNTSYQTLLAEKLSLERQLNSLEVQIENERRAFERARLNDLKQEEEEMRLRSELEKIQTQMAKEISERRRLERENHERTLEWEGQKKLLEDKLETLRKKLRSTKDRLKEAQNESQKPPIVLTKDRTSEAGSRAQRISLNRATSGFDPDMTIATPGAVQATGKIKRSSALPGDKSSFSITPYLRRTNTAPDSPASSIDGEEGGYETREAPDNDIDSDNNSNVKSEAGHAKPAIASAIRDSTDHDDVGRLNELSGTKSTAAPVRFSGSSEGIEPTIPNAPVNTLSMQGRQKQKKRKLLGSQREKTLFDEEDEKPERGRKDKRLASGQNLAINHSQFFSGSSRGFGGSSEFSPLKRGKRPL
ncbi:hypothetical protein VTN77DRAFT_9913 [Rasamsonia byssochlamydoides]|uniref:uncharacterized protein n=1 Tax=Rasamsonia byssochlamydoides TaxID=89139 RepID=UPI003744356F